MKVSDYYWNQLRQAKGEAYEAYCAVVQHFHENLPVNTSFAEITPGARHVPQALDFGRTARGEITAREELSDLDFVSNSYVMYFSFNWQVFWPSL